MKGKRVIKGAACLGLGLLMSAEVLAGEIPSSKDTLDALAKELGSTAKDLLSDEKLILAGDSMSDWIAFDYARCETAFDSQDYLKGLSDHVTASYKEKGGLDSFKATEWHRIALTVRALGGDPTLFGKDADGNPINLLADGTSDYKGDFDNQGLNAWIYALILEDSDAYDLSPEAHYGEKEILDHFLSVQEADGGFGLTPGASDVDITAMTLQALAPHTENPEIASCVEDALAWLSDIQNADGSFTYYGASNTESCAQVIMALCALDIDPDTDSRFVKEDGSVLDAMLSYRLPSGVFGHDQAETFDVMATEQAIRALNSYERLQDGSERLYDLSKITKAEVNVKEEKKPGLTGILMAAAGIAALCLVFFSLGKRNKK